MSVPTLKAAYDTSFAVFSPRVRFVEWTMYKVPSTDPHTWMPYYEYTGELLWDTVQEIKGKRWIYAFRSPMEAGMLKQTTAAKFEPSTYRQSGPTRLVDEFFLDENKQLHATPMDKMWADVQASKTTWSERGKHGSPGSRGTQIPIGTTTSFVRQFLGKPFVHYFFASRVQLPSSVIDQLQSHIADWVPGISFLPNDPYLFTGYAGQSDPDPAVPVLDPITIASYLHEFYIKASDDVTKYLTPDEDKGEPRPEEDKKKVKERQRKLMLAQIVDSVVDNDRKLVGTDDENRLYSFLNQYEEQVQFRKEWRNRWAAFLAYWLQSGPILLLATAHQFDEVADFPEFLLHMAHVHFRLSDSPEGRDLLKMHFTHPEKFPWVQKYVFSKGDISSDLMQGFRRTGSAFLEFVKEHAPAIIALGKDHVEVEVMEHALHKLYKADIKKPVKLIFGKEKGGWLFALEDSEGVPHLEFVERHEANLLQLETSLEHPHDFNPRELKPMWKGAVGSLLEGIELINFALALNSFEKAADAGGKEKVIALLELTEAGIHLTHATLELEIFGKASQKTLAKLAFASAVIDVVLGAQETIESLSEAQLGKALGSGIVTVGSMIVALGFFAESSLAGPVGMAIMGVGYFVRYVVFRDPSEYENFVYFSAFGDPGAKGNWDGDEEPKWYETEKKFKEWANDYDEQLRAAVALLCRFTIEPEAIKGETRGMEGSYPPELWWRVTEEKLLTGKIQLGWVPRGAKLRLQLSESWADASDSRQFSAEIEFSGNQEKPKVKSTNLSVEFSDGGRRLIVKAPPNSSAKPILMALKEGSWKDGEFQGINKGLKKITLTGSLEVKLLDGTFKAGPVKDAVLYEPYP